MANLDDLTSSGGDPALDFANTVDPRGGPGPVVDHLPDYEAFAGWCARAGVVSTGEARALGSEARAATEPAKATWRRAISLREAIFRIFSAVADGASPPPDDLVLLQVEWRSGQSATVLAGARRPEPGEPALRLTEAPVDGLASPLARIAAAAVGLLTTMDPRRIRSCPVDEGGCGWVVLDQTRNRSRRWCDMATCGNEVKAARLTERRRAARASGPAGSSKPRQAR